MVTSWRPCGSAKAPDVVADIDVEERVREKAKLAALLFQLSRTIIAEVTGWLKRGHRGWSGPCRNGLPWPFPMSLKIYTTTLIDTLTQKQKDALVGFLLLLLG